MLLKIDDLKTNSLDPSVFVATTAKLRSRLEGLREGEVWDSRACELPDKEWVERFKAVEVTLASLTSPKKGIKTITLKKAPVAQTKEEARGSLHRRMASRGSFIEELQNTTSNNVRHIFTKTPKSSSKLPPRPTDLPVSPRGEQYRMPTMH